jgi:hypothetical protein
LSYQAPLISTTFGKVVFQSSRVIVDFLSQPAYNNISDVKLEIIVVSCVQETSFHCTADNPKYSGPCFLNQIGIVTFKLKVDLKTFVPITLTEVGITIVFNLVSAKASFSIVLTYDPGSKVRFSNEDLANAERPIFLTDLGIVISGKGAL